MDPADLFGLGSFLVRIALDLLPKLRDLFGELSLLAFTRAATDLEQFLLARGNASNRGIVDPSQKIRWKGHLVRAVALSLAPGLARREFVQCGGYDGKIGARQGFVESQH